MRCLICDQPNPERGWVLCGTTHGDCCIKQCRFCQAELHDGWDAA